LLTDPAAKQGTQKMTVQGGSLVIQTETVASSKINSIEQWTTAFISFMSIFCTAHPNRFQELATYMLDGRLGAKRNPELGWKLYDEQLKLRKAVNPESSWSLVDMEHWLMYMTNNNNNIANANVVSPGYRSGSVNMNLSRRLKCYEFNYEGKCSKQECQYSHLCIHCNGGHQ
jgi:hypothetical protein